MKSFDTVLETAKSFGPVGLAVVGVVIVGVVVYKKFKKRILITVNDVTPNCAHTSPTSDPTPVEGSKINITLKNKLSKPAAVTFHFKCGDIRSKKFYTILSPKEEKTMDVFDNLYVENDKLVFIVDKVKIASK
jgi:hypothetical protein